MQAAHGAEEPPSEDIIDALVAHLHDPELVPTLVGKLFPIYPLLSSPADTNGREQERIDQALEKEQVRTRQESVVAQVGHSIAITTQFVAGGGQPVLTPNREGLESALRSLDDEKFDYLHNVRYKVRSYIKDQSVKDCLGIIETVTVNGKNVPDYYKFSYTSAWSIRFAAFTAGRDPAHPPQYDGNPLDSFLTDPVKDKVVDTTLRFYREHEGQLVDCLADLLRAMPVFRNGIREQIQLRLSQVQPPITPLQQAELATIVTDDILGPIATSFFAIDKSNAENHVAVAKQAIRATLAKSIAEIVRDYLSRPEFRTQIESLVSGAVYSTIMLTIITSLATIGVVTVFSVSAWWMIAPPLVGMAWVTYKAANIPGDLGKKVSEAIGKRLDESFRPCNEQILSIIFEDTVRNKLVQVGNALMDNDDVAQNIRMRLQQQLLIEG